MKAEKKHTQARKNRRQLLNETLPQIEQFIESRESYIKALETTVDALRRENDQSHSNNLAIRSSIDELVAMQRLSNTISTALDPELIVSTLIDLTKAVIPVIDCNIFLFDTPTVNLVPLSSKSSLRLQQEAQQQLEAGIVDWVISEKKTVVIPDLTHLLGNSTARNFVIVPLILRNVAIGLYVVHTEKAQQDFSNQDIQSLTVLANQAAAGVENWRAYEKLAQVNAELERSQAQMIQAAKLATIGELAANIIHEVKNPVQVLMMHMDLVRLGKPVPNWVELFGQQVKRLAEIVKRLMNFARSVAEDVSFGPVDINKAVEDIVTIVRHEFEGSRIQIDMSLAKGLPPVNGNANYLQQVFLNLLLNARDAMPDGGAISIASETTGYQNIVRFSDTGCGIAKEHLPKLFVPFFTTKGEGKGTGLGLSISNEIIVQHKGEIKVESEENKGTTFTINLPAKH
jgi:signal transduction histidine kinase